MWNGDENFFLGKYNKTRKEWYRDKLYKEKGATNNIKQIEGPYLRHTKGQGGSSEMKNNIQNENVLDMNKRHKYVPPRFDMENLFSFNYEDMVNEQPNKKFNILLNRKFTHEFYNKEKDEEQERWIELYNEMKNDGRLDIVNNIYQRFSNYIKKNKLSNQWVDGSIICNTAIIIAEYIKTGTLKYDYDFLNNIDEYNEDDDFRFHLWLILQCFTSKNIYYKKYIGNEYVQNWWAICHLRHRFSNKDMKTKGQCCGFKDNNGKYIYKNYGKL